MKITCKIWHIWYANSGLKHGFFFVAPSQKKALEDFKSYAKTSLGSVPEDKDLNVEEVMDDAVVTREPGKLTISSD
jgi:hypothetical protein